MTVTIVALVCIIYAQSMLYNVIPNVLQTQFTYRYSHTYTHIHTQSLIHSVLYMIVHAIMSYVIIRSDYSTNVVLDNLKLILKHLNFANAVYIYTLPWFS